MLASVLALGLLLAAPAPHGGHFIPPAPDPGTPEPVNGILGHPGLGPSLTWDPSRWEWWFHFNQSALLDLRLRLPARAVTAGSTWWPVTDADRGSTVVPLLVDCLRDKPAAGLVQMRVNPRDVRAAAVVALGRLQRSDAVPFIEQVLESDADLFVRTQAVLALGFSGSPQAVEALARIFRDPQQPTQMRTYAAAGLGLVANLQALDVLRAALGEKALQAEGNQMRLAILHAAGVSGDAGLLGALDALLPSDLVRRDAAVRAMLAYALGRLGDATTRDALLALASDADTQVRRSAAAGLEALVAAASSQQVERLLQLEQREGDVVTRRGLLRALGGTRTAEARARLQLAVADGPFDDRPHAAMGLALDGHHADASALLAVLADEHEPSRTGACAIALGLIGSPEARAPVAERLLQPLDPLVLSNLCLAAGLLQPDDPRVPARLEQLARESPDVEVMRSAVIGLGLLGRRDTLAALAAELPDLRRLMARASLAHALGLVGDRRLIEPLMQLARDTRQHAYVRAYALQALGELCDPRDESPLGRLSAHVEGHLDTGFTMELYFAL